MVSASIDIDAEVVQILENLEKVEGTEIYQPLITKGCLCDQKQWMRVLREVAEVNRDFQNLRTYIAPVSSFIGIFHFLIYPADGAMADQPLCGRILIPKHYPIVPPVVHLLTKTGRYNVDAYYRYGDSSRLLHMHSSMCFDILRSQANGGIWKPEFTLSALMASLIQSIVCIKVPQESGEEIEEFVSMSALEFIHANIKKTYDSNKSLMPLPKSINKIEAAAIKTKYFLFDGVIRSLRGDTRYQIVTAEKPIRLQVKEEKKHGNVYSIGFDLSDLKNNPKLVFAIVLSNAPDDPLGQKEDTVLVRNGVTATAAKKRRGQKLQWFYHGKPLHQDNLKIIVTVGYDQFCLSYLDENGRSIIHGDCPVSFLTEAEIGSVKKEDFYLSLFMRNKEGPQVTIKTFIPNTGFLHPAYSELEAQREKRLAQKIEAQLAKSELEGIDQNEEVIRETKILEENKPREKAC